MMNGGKIRILHVVALGVAFLLARAVTAAEAPYCDLNDIKGIGARRAAAKTQAELEARGIGKMPITTRKLDEAERNLDKLGEARVEKISNTPDEVLRFRGAVGDAKAEAGVVAKEAETAAKPAVSAAEKAPAPKPQYVPPEIRGHEKDYERLTGNYYNLENGSVLEGSVKDGHLQPDYLIDFNAPAFKPLRDFAHDVKAMNVPTAEKIELVRKFIHGKELTHSSYTNPEYRALLAKYRGSGRDIPLSQYVACKAGVCRENALFMHMALKEADIPNSYVYAKVRQAVFEGGKKTFDETEDHAFTIVNIDGKRWIADSYNSNFHGYNFDQLSDPYLKRGTTLEHLPGAAKQDKDVLRQIVAINNFPVAWNPKTEEAAARGAQAFRDSELKNPPKPVYTDGTYLGEKKNARIGVYSGTFDPPHAGHMEAIQKALSEGKLDEIYIYVNRDPAHKPDATAFALRQKMAELAFAGDPRVKFVDPAKVREGTASQFLERMAAGNHHHTYYGIYGDDVIASPGFRPGTASNIRYIVAGRGTDTEMVESAIKARFGERLKANPDLVIRVESSDANSSDLKARIMRGEQPPEMFPTVAKFAEENKIYSEPKGERKLASVGAETSARYSLVDSDDSGLKARLEKVIGQHFDLGVAPAIKGEARLPTRYESLERLNKTAQLWNDVRPGPEFRAALDKVIATGQSSKEFDKQVEELRSRIKTIRFLCESLCRDEAHLKDLNALGTALGGLQDAAKPGFGSKRQITAAAKTLKSELSVEKLVNIDHKLAILQPVTEKELGERMAENVKSIRKAIDAKDVSEADFHNVRLKIGNMQAVVLTGALTDESKKAEKSEKAAYEKFRDIFGKLGEVHDDLVKAQLHDAAVGRVTFTDGQKSEIEKVLGYFEKNRVVARSLETSDKELGLSEQIHALIENGSKTGLQPRLGGVPHLPTRSETEARMAEIGKLWEETRPRDSLRRELEEVVKNRGRYSPQLRAELKEARSFYKVIRFFCDALCTEDSKLKQFDKLTKALGTVNDIMGLDVKNELGHALKVLGKNFDKPEEALVAAIKNALKEMKPKKLDLVDIEMAKMTPLTAGELAPEIEKDIKGIRKALYSESIEEKQFHDVRKALGRMQTIVLSNAFSEDGTKQEKASFTAFRKLYDEIGDIHDEMVNGSRPEEYTFTNKQRGGIERLIGYFEQSDHIEPGKLPKAAEKFVDRNARYSLVDTDAGLAADRGQALSALRGSYAAKMTPADAAAFTGKLTRRLEGYDPLYVKAAIEGSANGRRDVEEVAEFVSQVSAKMSPAGASRELIAATIAGGVGGPRSAEEASNFARILDDDLKYAGYDKRTIAAAVQGSVGGKFEPEEAVAFTRNLAADLKIDGFDDQHVNAVLRGGADGNLTAKQASEFSRELSAQLKDAGVPRDIALAAVEGSLGKHLLPTEARVLTKDLIGKLTQQGYDHDTIVAAVAGGAGNYASADRTVAYVRELAGAPESRGGGRALASVGAAGEVRKPAVPENLEWYRVGNQDLSFKAFPEGTKGYVRPMDGGEVRVVEGTEARNLVQQVLLHAPLDGELQAYSIVRELRGGEQYYVLKTGTGFKAAKTRFGDVQHEYLGVSESPGNRRFASKLGFEKRVAADGSSEIRFPSAEAMTSHLKRDGKPHPVEFVSFEAGHIDDKTYAKFLGEGKVLISTKGYYWHDADLHAIGFLELADTREWVSITNISKRVSRLAETGGGEEVNGLLRSWVAQIENDSSVLPALRQKADKLRADGKLAQARRVENEEIPAARQAARDAIPKFEKEVARVEAIAANKRLPGAKPATRYSLVDTDGDRMARQATIDKPVDIKLPAASRSVSDERLSGALVMSTESIERDPFTLAQLRMTGAMSASGPLGWDSPANVLGPTGWFGPSALISSFDWSKDAKKMVDGPLLSENGVFSARGPVGRAYENPAFAAYREDGPLLVLGPKGPLGPYGALGPLGEDGATGYKLDPKTGAFVHDGKVVTEAQVREGNGLVMRDLVEHYKPEYARSLSEKGELGGSFKMDDTIYPGQSRELNVNVKAGTVQTFAVSSEDGVFGRAGLRLLDENGTVLAKAESHENVNFVSLRVPHDTTVKVEITNFSGVPYYAANPFDVRNNLVTLHSTQAPVDSALHDFNKSYFSMLKGPENRSIASVADTNQARYSRVETDRRKTLAGIDTRTSQFAQRQAAYGVDVKAVPQAAYRSMFSKEKWFREKQAVFTAIESDKENTSFKNLAETANRGDSSRVKTSVLVETAVTKDLNDVVVKDKDLVTALMNTHKDVLWTAIQRDELLSKHLIAKYTDFKSMKFAFDSDDPAVARRLKEIHADVNRRYAEFVSSEAEKQGWGDKATGLAAEVANWNHMGIGGTPDEANWAARQSRTMLDNGLSRARAFSDPEVKAAVERDLAEVAKLRRDAVARFAGVEGTTVEEAGQRVLSAEAIETIRKAKATEDSEAARLAAVKKALKERFDHDFSDSDVKAARDYAAKVDVFSPDLYITKTEKIGMEHHTNGVISVDFKGQNARNIEETMKALARTEGDKSTRAQMLAIRAGEEKATAELDRRKAEVSAALLELTKRISKSGDDMHGLLEEMVASDGKHWFAHRAGPSEVRTVFSPSFYADTGTKIPGELMQEYMGRGEEIEKSLSKAMYGAFPGERKMLNRAQIVIDMEPDSKGNHAMNVLVGGEVSASDRQKIANWASGYLAEKGVRSDFARALDGRPADVAGSFQHVKPVSMDKYVPPSVVGHEKDFVKTNERFRDVPNGAVVEGSVKFGKLQPDYIINYDAPEFAKLREFSRGLRATNLAEEDKANLVKDFIRGELLTNHRYDDLRYRQLIQKYRDAGKDVPISEYAACKAGVCRENAIYLHLALKDAGVPNDFVYARVRETWPEANGGKHDVTEDHAFVVYQARGKRWIADSYDSNFHGFSFDQLSQPSLAPNAQLEHLASAKVRPGVYRKIVELNDYPVIWKPITGTEAKIDSISPKLVEALHGSPSKLEARLNEAISELPAYSGGSEEKQLERALKESFPGRKVTLAVPSDPGKSGDTVWMVFENGKPVSALKIYRRQPPVDFAMEVESLKTIGNPSSRVSFSAPKLEGAFSLESGGHRNPALIVSAANGHDVSSLFRRLLDSPAQVDRKQVEGISRAVAGGLGALHREFADTKPTAEMLEEFKVYQVSQARKELEETFGSGAFERKGWITGAERAALQDKINSLINDYEKDDISSRASFMHGDFHSGNIFVDGENKPTFIDTGSAAYMIYRDRDGAPLFVGDPYADVGRFLESVSNDSVADKGRAARGQAAMEKSFLEEYTKVTGTKLPNMQKALDFYRFQYDQKYFTAKFGNSEDQQRKILGHVLERLGIRQATAGPAVVAREVPLYSSKSLPELRLTRPAVANAILYREAATGELAAARHAYFNGKGSLKQLDAVNAKYGYLETPVTGASERARRVGYLAQEENYLNRLADQARVDGDLAKAKRLERDRAAVSAQLLAEQGAPAKVTSASRRGAVEALASDDNFARYANGRTFADVTSDAEDAAFLRAQRDRDARALASNVSEARKAVSKALSDDSARAEKLTSDLVEARAAGEADPAKLRAKGWSVDEVSRCREAGLCAAWKPAADEPVTMAASTRGILYEGELAGGHAADEALAVAKPPSHAHTDVDSLLADLRAGKDSVKGESEEASRAASLADERIRTLSQERDTLKDARPLTHDDAKFNDKATAAAVSFLSHADEGTLAKLGLGDLPKAGEGSEGRLKTYEAFRAKVVDMEPEARAAVFSAVRESAAKGKGELATALKQATAPKEVALAKAIERADAVAAAAGKKDPALTRAIYRDEKLSKGDQALADAIGAAKASPKSSFERHAEEAAATKKLAARGPASEAHATFRTKAEADLKGAAGLKEPERKELLASLEKQAKSDPEKARAALAHLQALWSNPDMFDTYRMAYVSASREMEKLKNWDKAWEAGVKDMLLKSSYSDEEVMKVVDKESGLRFYQQIAHCL